MSSPETYERLTVGSVMHHGVIQCEPQAPLEEVARLMAEEDTHSVVVGPASSPDVRAWRLISDVDLMRALGNGRLSGEAFGAAASEMVTIASRERLERAAQMMGEHECSHLLVTAADSERPVGVISSLDVIRGLVWGWRPTNNATT